MVTKMKTTNEKKIRLYGFDMGKRYYLTHPWKWFGDLFTLIKNAYHRMRYGYAWVDLWNMSDYLGELIPNMLRVLAEKSQGWPESKEFPAFEDWQKHLNKLADMFEESQVDVLSVNSPLHDQFFAVCDAANKRDKQTGRHESLTYKFTEDEQKIVDAWHKYVHDEEERHDELRREVFAKLAAIWTTLWD